MAFAPELVLYGTDECFEIALIVVDLVDDDQAWEVAIFGYAHHPPCHRLDARMCIDDDTNGLDGGEYRNGLADKVAEPRGVDEINHVSLVVEVEHRGAEGVLVVFFFF